MGEEGQGVMSRLGDAVKAVVNEAIMPAAEKLIPQGAAELAQALFAESAYMPYGLTNMEVPMPETGNVPQMEAAAIEAPVQAGDAIEAPATEAASVEPAVEAPVVEAPAQGSYEASLDAYGLGGYEQDHGQDLSR